MKPSLWFHLSDFILPCSPCPLRKEEGWLSPTLHWLLRTQQIIKEGSVSPTPHLWPTWLSKSSKGLHKNWSSTCLPPGLHYQRWWVENRLQDLLWLIWVAGDAFQSHQCPCSLSVFCQLSLCGHAWCLHCSLPLQHPSLLGQYGEPYQVCSGSASAIMPAQALHQIWKVQVPFGLSGVPWVLPFPQRFDDVTRQSQDNLWLARTLQGEGHSVLPGLRKLLLLIHIQLLQYSGSFNLVDMERCPLGFLWHLLMVIQPTQGGLHYSSNPHPFSARHSADGQDWHIRLQDCWYLIHHWFRWWDTTDHILLSHSDHAWAELQYSQQRAPHYLQGLQGLASLPGGPCLPDWHCDQPQKPGVFLYL